MHSARALLTGLTRRIQKRQLLEGRRLVKDQIRRLNVHEHVAYSLLNQAGIPTPPFKVAKTPEEAAEHATCLDSRDIVLKAQVLTGGRGKGTFKGKDIGGVVLCDTPEQACVNAEKMIGEYLVTKQSGPEGKICNTVMITTRMFPRKEFYLAVMMERSFGGPAVIISTEGGVNIEDTAASRPDAIAYFPIDIDKGICPDEAQKIADKLGLEEKGGKAIAEIIIDLYKLFIEKDALLLEINPLVEDICGDYYALDCKCNFDDSAEFRQKELFELRDWTQKDPRESQAEKFNLNYIPLDGNIACMVNGAGLAMATMDIIKLNGGEPANFLDVGGGASAETVKEAFKIISSDPKVKNYSPVEIH
uniref:SUCLA2_1 protein n=1 Tax=Fopius arisanus TaxID=64838 RepID=A0A0C9R375_9HYME